MIQALFDGTCYTVRIELNGLKEGQHWQLFDDRYLAGKVWWDWQKQTVIVQFSPGAMWRTEREEEADVVHCMSPMMDSKHVGGSEERHDKLVKKFKVADRGYPK